MSKNNNLHAAKKAKNDEFYTQLSDIENELRHYKRHFKNKIVLCNCDDPVESNFYMYFVQNFEHLGLKKLISTHFDPDKPTYKLEVLSIEDGGDKNGNGIIDVGDTIKTPLVQNGDFRSDECIEILKEADIVVTNPPFSLFREYVSQLIEYDKKFLIIGNKNAITYKEIFGFIKGNKLWLGCTSPKEFILPGGEITKKINGLTRWYTNLPHRKRAEPLILYKVYRGHKDEYPKYDNYQAIEVGRVKDIPKDYKGIMGVPITFLDSYCPEQFKIVGSFNAGAHAKELGATKTEIVTNGKTMLWNGPVVNKEPLYKRIMIKRKK